ncbi:MAG: OprO/OprP family phosphate-selective porin, partial [Planctomycetota bacterium]
MPTRTVSGQLVSLGNAYEELDARLSALEVAAEQRETAGVMTVKPEGRVYLDWTTFDQSALNKSPAQFGDAQNAFQARMARIGLTGSGFDVIDYEVEMDFGPLVSSGLAGHVVKDLYVAVRELPVLGRVTVGYHKEPFSLEGQTSSRFIMFAERSMSGTATAFNPRRNVGISAGNTYFGQRGTWAIGAFISDIGDRPPFLSDDHLGTAVTMRYTLLPWYDEATEGRGLLHVGAGYSWRDQIRHAAPDFKARPNTFVGPFVVDTPGLGPSDDRQLLNFELAVVYGPFCFQSEYFGAFVGRMGAADVDFHGAYGQISCFLTGEHRPYLRCKGYLDRIRPYENYFRLHAQDGSVRTGSGAWEVAYRYDWIDLNDAGVAGGAAGTHTVGLNWYLTPYTRVVWNYIHADCHPDQTSDPTKSDLNAFL